MKLKNFLLFFIAGMFGIWFGYLVLGKGLANFSFEKLDFGDVPTWTAALGTIGTFIYMMFWNKQIRAEQKKQDEERKAELDDERSKREAHEEKQQKMWNQQQEMLTFEKFQKHKAAFHSVLDQLENNPHIKFYDREALYESLFPHNSFENCVTDQANADFLSHITDSYLSIWEQVKQVKQQPNNPQVFVDYFSKINTLGHDLQLRLITTREVGNIHWKNGSQPFMSNIFYLKESIYAFNAVIQRLCSFCHFEMSDFRTEPLDGEYLIPFYNFILSPNGRQLYRTDFDEFKPVLSILLRAYQEFNKPGWNNNSDDKKMVEVYIRISKLIFDSPRLIELFSSNEEVVKLKYQLLDALGDYVTYTKNPNSELSSIHLDLISLMRK